MIGPPREDAHTFGALPACAIQAGARMVKHSASELKVGELCRHV